MKTPNTQLMKQAREALKGRWGLAVGTFFVYTVIQGATSTPEHILPDAFALIVGAAALVWLIFVYGPLALGAATFSLAIARNDKPKFSLLFAGFKQNYWKSIGLLLFMLVLVILGMILFVVPGIIVALMLALSFFILRDNPGIDVIDALKKSRKMMVGYKWKLFGLVLIFIGLMLLVASPFTFAILAIFDIVVGIPFLLLPSILVLAIGWLFLYPFMQITFAKFYEDVKANNTDMA